MKIKINPINPMRGYKPMRAHYNDAGADVRVPEDVQILPWSVARIPLGFSLEIPDGYAGFIFPRSSMTADGIICQIPPIDSGYRGEISALVYNTTEYVQVFPEGAKIGQLVILPVVYAEFEQDLGKERYDGAFGSTGE